MIETADIAELNEEQQQRGGVLKSRHYRLRRELDQRTEPDQAEKRLQHAAEKNDRESDGKNKPYAAGGDLRRAGMDELVNQKANEERAVDPRRINRRRPVTKHHANDGDDKCRRKPGKRAVGKIAFAKRGKGEHAVAHGEWNGHGGGNQPAGKIATHRR